MLYTYKYFSNRKGTDYINLNMLPFLICFKEKSFKERLAFKCQKMAEQETERPLKKVHNKF